jgi:hypothetical protein
MSGNVNSMFNFRFMLACYTHNFVSFQDGHILRTNYTEHLLILELITKIVFVFYILKCIFNHIF